jgi:hypothetical protein
MPLSALSSHAIWAHVNRFEACARQIFPRHDRDKRDNVLVDPILNQLQVSVSKFALTAWKTGLACKLYAPAPAEKKLLLRDRRAASLASPIMPLASVLKLHLSPLLSDYDVAISSQNLVDQGCSVLLSTMTSRPSRPLQIGSLAYWLDRRSHQRKLQFDRTFFDAYSCKIFEPKLFTAPC